MVQRRETYQDIVKALTKSGMALPDAMNVARCNALENLKEKLSKDYEMNMVLTRLKNK